MTGYLHPMQDEIRLGLVRVGDQDSMNVRAVNGDIGDMVERVSTGLLLVQAGDPDDGRQMLEVADAWTSA
jgi:hypothetical protein